MARPELRTKTEKSIYRRLHADVDVWRSEWSIPERNTRYARETIKRWKEAGILEARNDSAAGSRYPIIRYRLAPEWRDDSLIESNLVDALVALDDNEARTAKMLADSTKELGDVWGDLRSVIDTGPPADEETSRDVSQALYRAHSLLHSIARHKTSLAAFQRSREKLEEQMSSRPSRATGSDDPLGGDA